LKEINKNIVDSGKTNVIEIRREERYSTRMELDEIFQKGMLSGKSRDEVIFSAYRDYDYSMREIGDYLGMHYATVSRAIKKCEKERKD
jgi:DNA-binding MarR family transcriptional regulator